MKVATNLNNLKLIWQNQFPHIDFNASQNDVDFNFFRGNWNEDPWIHQNKTILWMHRIKTEDLPVKFQDKNSWPFKKTHYCTDDFLELPCVKNFIFSSNDFCGDQKIIVSPNGFLYPSFITGTENYWLKDNKQNSEYFNKVYWKGSFNHESRNILFDFYKQLKDPRFILEEFNARVYSNPCSYQTYKAYINTLQQSDMNFCIRGTYDGTYSFMDTIRCGCIPILVNCMLNKGWENIFNEPEDFCLRFDVRKDSVEYIHTKILEVLNDKERVLFMKSNVRKFYKNFIYKDGRPIEAWSNFYLAKCIEIARNNFDSKKNTNQFISSEILNLLNLPKL